MDNKENNEINSNEPKAYDEKQESYDEEVNWFSGVSSSKDADSEDDTGSVEEYYYHDDDEAEDVEKIAERNYTAIQNIKETNREIRRKKRKMRKVRFLAILIGILVVSLFVGGMVFIDKKGYADVEQIVITGNSHYDTAYLLETSGAVTGVGLISLRTSQISNNLESLPYIKSVDVVKKYPHTLKIVVEERTAEYALYVGGFYLCVDSNMTILDKANEPEDLKIIEGFVPVEAKVGKTFVAEDEENFANARSLADAIQEKGLSIYKISYRNSTMRLYFTKNILCEGSYDNLMQYIDVMNEILYSLSSQGIERGVIFVGEDGYISYSPAIE